MCSRSQYGTQLVYGIVLIESLEQATDFCQEFLESQFINHIRKNWSLENDLASLAPIAQLQSGSQADLAAVWHAPVWQYAQSRPMMPDRCLPDCARSLRLPDCARLLLPDRCPIVFK